ncbi:dual specificity protein tyrosine phosphatase CCP1 [[Candida] anglica]|uniref:protein-tyrosine-phosphatase n=1 Tax=[Candida] anglica TaxID=148631 RepID=A0ABP0EML0_9ASCO
MNITTTGGFQPPNTSSMIPQPHSGTSTPPLRGSSQATPMVVAQEADHESTNSLEGSGSLNYSPKHSRKYASLSTNRNINMKNLSLNLVGSGSNGTANGNGNGNVINNNVTESPAIDVPHFIKPLTRRKTLTLAIPSEQQRNNIEPPLITPNVTKTPKIPPLISRQKAHTVSNGSPNITNNTNNPFLSHTQIHPQPKSNMGDRNPFRELNHKSNNLQSPFLMNTGKMPDIEGQIINDFSGLQVKSDTATTNNNDTTNATINNNLNDTNYINNNHTSTQRSHYINIPEELQESSQLEAYPNGPANVLNGSLFLYSDPDPLQTHHSPQIDVNDYDLVINVARECRDLTEEYVSTEKNGKEYIHITWSHTSSISKELPILVEKIAKYDDSDSTKANKRKILIHCQCGVSRSACVVVGYYMYKFGVGVNEAYEVLKTGTVTSNESFNSSLRERGYYIEACDRICPNMSLIFELMEFGDLLKKSSPSSLI